jgi:SAM-dependent methyltransferase
MISLEFDGSRKQRGALRVGEKAEPGVGVVADVRGGLPFKDDSVEEIYLDHTLEDVHDFVAAMREIWRVCRPGALVHVWLPHASSTWATSRNPGQTRPFTIETFDFFDPERNPDYPTGAAFEIEQAKLYLTTLRLGQRPRLTGGLISSVVETLANRSRGNQYRWERWLGATIGFEEFYVLLTAVKTPAWAEA